MTIKPGIDFSKGCLPMRNYNQIYRPVDAPDSYWAASKEAKAWVCNGAGPRLFGWMVPDRIWGLSITEAADVHDWMYSKGQTLREKKEADLLFLVNMVRIVNGQTTRVPVVGFLLKCLRLHRAVTYYLAVREFGIDAFFSGKGSGHGYEGT